MKISEEKNRIRERKGQMRVSVCRARLGGRGISIQFKRGRGNNRKRAELSLARNRKTPSLFRSEMKTNHIWESEKSIIGYVNNSVCQIEFSHNTSASYFCFFPRKSVQCLRGIFKHRFPFFTYIISPPEKS